MRYFIELQYKGTRYHGWQAQNNAKGIQNIIEEKLAIVLRQKTEIVGCGRTDTGVHARQYFAHFDFENPLPEGLIKSLNGLLPNDIAILKIESAQPEEHARFDARLRTYRYFIHTRKDAFLKDTSYLHIAPLNIEAMNLAGYILTQNTEFGAFCKAGGGNKTTRCAVSTAKWFVKGSTLYFEISADRFLRNMVRAIVGTMLEVGEGKITIDEFEAIVQSQDRTHAGSSAPAEGLFLWKVQY